MNANRSRSWKHRLALLASVAVAAFATGCGHRSELLTTTDVRKAFADEGLSLVPDKDKAPHLHFLWYGRDGGNEERMAVFVYDEPTGATDARNLAKLWTGAADISEMLVARNVLVVILPRATPNERRGAVRAATALRRK